MHPEVGCTECSLVEHDDRTADLSVGIAAIASGAVIYMTVMAGVKAKTARDPKDLPERKKRG